MPVSFSLIIPARYGSSRLPGKPLLEIKGKPLIQHVYEIAVTSQARQIYIATDDGRIADKARSFGADVVMTSTQHQSGTDRIGEAVTSLNIPDDEIVINLQGDEYGLSPQLIDQVATGLFNRADTQVATLCEPIHKIEDYMNSNIVKLVLDADNTAIYFSRSPIPSSKVGHLPERVYRHIGLYAYRTHYLKKIIRLKPCILEKTEMLEQLRILYYRDKIHVAIATSGTGIGIDTLADLESARMNS